MSKDRIIKNSKIDEVTRCWNWTGAKKGSGKLTCYGSLTIGSRTDNSRRTISAHRYSYIVFNGDIPKGAFVCHKCDNPSCVNPEHLFVGTRQDNVNDRESKNRNNHVFGKESRKSGLTELDIINIIQKYDTGNYSLRELAKEYNIKSHKSILEIINRKTWSHVILPEPPNH